MSWNCASGVRKTVPTDRERNAQRRRRNWLLVVAVLVLMFFGRWSVDPERVDATTLPFYTTSHDPLVIAHRGGAHLRPENTLPAFDHAVALGADVLEMDLRSTADGHIVVFHDETVERTTNGNGFVHALTLDALKSLDAAYHFTDQDGGNGWRGQGVQVPTLAEVLERYPAQRMSVEIKQREPSLVNTLCAQLADKRDHVLVASFIDEEINRFREVCPDFLTSASTPEITWFVTYQTLGVSKLFTSTVNTLQIPREKYGFNLLKRSLVRDAGRWGMAVEYWTLNDVEAMRSAIESGARGIVTDRPDVLLAELGRL